MLSTAGFGPDTIYLAAGATEYTDSLKSFAWIMAAALLAPLVSFMLGRKMPAVALLIIFGMIIGPSIMDVAHQDAGIGMVKELGVGALFLLAGFEIDLSTMKSREAKNALSTWTMCLAACVVGAFFLVDGFSMALVMGLALTSTALGTIMPVLQQEKLNGTVVGNSVMIHGAVGEVAPITVMALLLGTRDTFLTAIILLGFIAIAGLMMFAPQLIAKMLPVLRKAFVASAGATNQTTLRLIITVLAILMAIAAVFELDIVLGAFAAGIIFNRIIPEEMHKSLENRMNIVFHSMLIPAFFVVSGMSINWDSIVGNPLKVLGIPLLILFTRGLPVFLRENVHHTGSEMETWRERLQVALFAATGLPIIVAVTTIAVDSEIMGTETASIFIAGGALTVAIFPLLAVLVGPKKPRKASSSDDEDKQSAGQHPADSGDGQDTDEDEDEHSHEDLAKGMVCDVDDGEAQKVQEDAGQRS
ncbi:cation:proton antiporter [Corynebacterium phocae]|uniref:cation:proton antiporter n=1 Tax=Corynebacterium phocae TaxID=161895 RepID=UPI0009FF29F3|nr:cation:proton antiporter [Corynebacterium phocae]KAA8721693.1 cation:proton antiporter [Corynebacterium phocae]